MAQAEEQTTAKLESTSDKDSSLEEQLRINAQKKWLRKHGRPVPKALSHGEKQEYRKCFDLIDADGQGGLTAEELYKLLTVSSSENHY